MQCDELAELLAGAADGATPLEEAAEAHVRQCLRCQAELVQYRRLASALRSLRSELVDPGPGLLADVIAALEAANDQHALRALLTGRRAAYLGGIAAATAATAAGAAVLAARARRGRLRLAS